MAKYKCTNKKCSSYEEIEEVRNRHWKYTKDGVVDMIAPCPGCGEIRESVGESESNGLCTSMHGGINCCNK